MCLRPHSAASGLPWQKNILRSVHKARHKPAPHHVASVPGLGSSQTVQHIPAHGNTSSIDLHTYNSNDDCDKDTSSDMNASDQNTDTLLVLTITAQILVAKKACCPPAV